MNSTNGVFEFAVNDDSRKNREQDFVDSPVFAQTPWIGDVIPALFTELIGQTSELSETSDGQANSQPKDDSQADWRKTQKSKKNREQEKVTNQLQQSTLAEENLAPSHLQLRQILELEDSAQAVLIVVDGLGYELLLGHLAYTPTLRGFKDQIYPLTTCAPSTTAAALASLTTGAKPAQTKMVGYSVLRPEHQFFPRVTERSSQVMNLLTFSPEVDAFAWQPQPTWFQRLPAGSAAVITSPRFQNSGMTKATLRGAEFVGRESLTDRFTAGIQEVRLGRKFTYIYWSEIDHIGHVNGPGSEKWLAEVENFDRALGRFLAEIPENVPVVLTADHGMVERKQIIDLKDTLELANGVYALAGEGRCVHIHLEPTVGKTNAADKTRLIDKTELSNPAAEAALVERWQNYLGERALVVPRADLGDYLGEGDGINLVGAAVAFMKGRDVVVDSRTQSASSIAMKGVHGSLTPAEMLIPVVRLN